MKNGWTTGTPYDPIELAKEDLENLKKLILEDIHIIIDYSDMVEADLYSEQLDLKYTISGITFKDLIKILRADKHLEVECIEVS